MSKTHVIDGVTYVEVARKANVGELVYRDGIVRKVTKRSDICEGVEFMSFYDEEDGDYTCGWKDGSYQTLNEEVTVDGTQASEQVIEMLANLARRVTQLESQLADTQRNVERQAEELENAKHRISKHADMFGHVEAIVRNLNDEVIMLDERTQPNKFVELILDGKLIAKASVKGEYRG